jgi:16S rRNA processing protein RimM
LPERRILLGVIGRPHGVRGLVRVHSYTADPADLATYGPLADEAGRRFTLRWRGEGIAAISELVNGVPLPVRDRTQALLLVNLRLYIERERLKPAGDEEFYLADLIGLEAVTQDGRELGPVAAVHDYGGGASLEIGQLLLPFSRACVPAIDLAAGRLTVSPPAEIVVPPGAEAAP